MTLSAGTGQAGRAGLDPTAVAEPTLIRTKTPTWLLCSMARKSAKRLRGTSITWTLQAVITVMRMPWGSPLCKEDLGCVGVAAHAALTSGSWPCIPDLAGDGGGDQGGVSNRDRAVSSSPLHLTQRARQQGRCRAAGAAEEVIAREGDRSCF
jgi:hypothetical protein